ncbi:hypothetical protein COX84_05965, partial [Candidatus Micrarchaeota archaeon CG_4_10_14_0_2_um_filter_49_7]
MADCTGQVHCWVPDSILSARYNLAANTTGFGIVSLLFNMPFATSEMVIVKLAEYPALRAGMNAKHQLHENSRTTALEIFGKSSRTLRAIFQLERFNR